MNYVIAILINLLALNFRLWLFQNMFHRKRNKRVIFILVAVMWGISSLGMLLYPMILDYSNFWWFSFRSLSRQAITLLVCYVWAIGLLLAFFGRKISLWHKLFVRSIVFITLAAWVVAGVITLPVWAFLYFLCIAGAEEFLKLSVGQSFFAQYKLSPKDLLLFAILSAVWFALIENIVYLFRDPSIGLAISRNLTTVIMHVIFTGTIAYLIMKRGEKSAIRYFLAFLIWMGLHRAYNAFISYQNPIITAVLIVIGYFVLSYFLYKSDRLYLKK